MSDRIYIFDTTLRDGEQTPGVNLNVSEKTLIALQLERMGVDVVEAGFANASEGDFEAVTSVAKALKRATVCSLARAQDADIRAAARALSGAMHPRLHVFIATSEIHMQYKLKMTPEQVLARIRESVRQACVLCDEVQFSAEDATRSNPEFLYRALETAIDAGAAIVNIADTVGYSTVNEMGRLITGIRQNVRGIDRVVLGLHCHDDLGLAVANSIEGLCCGARQVEATINGMGERAGNAALEEIVMGLHTREDCYHLQTGIDTREIYRTSKLVSGFSNLEPSPGKAIVGANAFLHESGIHQHGVLNNRMTYEVMKAEDLGILGNGVVLGKLSGMHAFAERARSMGYHLSEEELEKAFRKFKEMADRKRYVTDKDIEAILGEQIIEIPPVYVMQDFQVFSNNRMHATATITLVRNGEQTTEAAVGNGPIEAAFLAVDRISGMELKLESYKVKAATEGRDALGEVVVRVSYGGKTATGRGISTDVIESSVLAYIAGLNRIISDIV